jgi:hypothetical protein
MTENVADTIQFMDLLERDALRVSLTKLKDELHRKQADLDLTRKLVKKGSLSTSIGASKIAALEADCADINNRIAMAEKRLNS